MLISKDIQRKLLCPKTKSKLQIHSDYLESVIDSNVRYPIIDGIPILINDEKSIFSIDDFIKRKNTTFNLNENIIKRIINKVLPKISFNIKAKENYNRIATMLSKNSRILVIGGSVKGQGMDAIYSNESFEIIGSDVSFGPYTKIICDAHDIPFEDEMFDCVIIQAVLEHVVDPQRCIDEVLRILKPNGIVYAETPFIQQVHMRQYDFTRFTYLGQRRLFKHFDEIQSGPNGGPGMALAWSYTYFLRSFSETKLTRLVLTKFGIFTSFFLKYFDYFLIDKPGSYDSASGYFFIGKKNNNCLSDRELINQFKGIL